MRPHIDPTQYAKQRQEQIARAQRLRDERKGRPVPARDARASLSHTACVPRDAVNIANREYSVHMVRPTRRAASAGTVRTKLPR